jgi:hypothetical protein
MSFSERYGFRSVRQSVQVDSINTELRNGLWSVLYEHVSSRAVRSPDPGRVRYPLSRNPAHRELSRRLWLDFFRDPVDQIPADWSEISSQLRKFFFSCEWFLAYDLLEFVANNYGFTDRRKFLGACNSALEREVAAYRFVDGLITRITDEEEISAIEDATESRLPPVKEHLHRALELMSSREQPDYRNSIKESISAVESLVMNTLGRKGTLGDLIKKLRDEIGLHPALSGAFEKLYGYTSDEGGVRHAILDSPNVRFEDAKFLSVACCAFVNFVTARVADSKR